MRNKFLYRVTASYIEPGFADRTWHYQSKAAAFGRKYRAEQGDSAADGSWCRPPAALVTLERSLPIVWRAEAPEVQP